MKKHLPAILPALALLTLGGCASSANLASTETDGMYYSAADKVTAAPVARRAPLGVGVPGDVANPDYNGSATRGASSRTAPEEEYYDDDEYYATERPRRNNYRGGSLGYYSFPYADPFYYGAGYAYSPYGPVGFSPYGFADPFYRPYGYGYGGLNINIGLGFGFGRPFYRPYGYGGYRGYGYDPFYGSPYGNYYGYNGYYGGGYYGGGYGGGYGSYGNGYGGYYGGLDRVNRNTTYGARRSRTGDGVNRGNVANGAAVASPGRGRVVQESSFASPSNGGAGTVVPNGRGRVRTPDMSNGAVMGNGQDMNTGRVLNNGTVQSAATLDGPSRNARLRAGQGQQEMAGGTAQPQAGARRWRVLDNANGGTQPSGGGFTNGSQSLDQPQINRGRRTYSNGGNEASSNGGYVAPTRRGGSSEGTPGRSYSQPSRSYSQPSRSYSEPSRAAEPSRSYSQPSRSYSSPSSGGSSSGGGNSGGGGGGGRGRVR